MPRFSGQSALVTGAASGIGRAIATQIAREGGDVLVTDIDGEGAEAVVRALRAEGVVARAARVDVRDRHAVAGAVADVVERTGRIDYLFNNAGLVFMGEARDLTLESWERAVDVNLRGVIHGVDAVYPRMIDQGQGHIVNVSSMAGYIPFPYISPYVTTKFAVYGLSTALQAEAARHGVSVSVVCPGPIRTRIYENVVATSEARRRLDNRFGGLIGMTPEACAERILRGVILRQSVINVTWTASLLWRVYRLAPWLVHAASRTAMRIGGAAAPPPGVLSATSSVDKSDDGSEGGQ